PWSPPGTAWIPPGYRLAPFRIPRYGAPATYAWTPPARQTCCVPGFVACASCTPYHREVCRWRSPGIPGHPYPQESPHVRHPRSDRLRLGTPIRVRPRSPRLHHVRGDDHGRLPVHRAAPRHRLHLAWTPEVSLARRSGFHGPVLADRAAP